MISKEDLEILDRVIIWADMYFTQFCEYTDTYVLDQDEIDSIEDESEQEAAQELFDYNNLLNQATDIINKLKGEK